MTTPNVYFSWCTREANCPWCKQLIPVATESVVVFFWNKGVEGNRKFNVKRHYHPDCWVASGRDYLKMNPYSSPGKRGRPKTELAPIDKDRRLTLLRKKAMLEQQKKRLTTPYPDRLVLENNIDEQIASVMFEITKCGGIPKSWLEKILNE